MSMGIGTTAGTLRQYLQKNPGSIVHLKLRWVERIQEHRSEEIACGWFGGLTIALGKYHFSMPTRIGDPEIEQQQSSPIVLLTPQPMRVHAWGLEKLGRGVWSLEPSVIHDFLHAFVTLVDVPDPAPWEKIDVPDAARSVTP